MGHLFFNIGLWTLISLFLYVAIRITFINPKVVQVPVKYTVYLDNAWREYRYNVGSRVKKTGGSYEAAGEIVGAFFTKRGQVRYIMEFDNPSGLLHIFNEDQLTQETLV